MQWLKIFHIWEIGDGSKIPLQGQWFGSVNQRNYQHQVLNVPNAHATVDGYIDHTNRTWRSDKLQQVFSDEQLQQIATISIPQQPATDKLRWSLTRNGQFIVNSAYLAILGQQIKQVVPKQQQQMWLLIWHLGVPYKCQMFIWKLVKDILPVAARFQKMAAPANLNCVMCMSHVETSTHLLLQCPSAEAIWSGVSQEIFHNATAYGDIKSWIQAWIDPISLVSKEISDLMNLAVITLWFIWKSRCIQFFESKRQPPGVLIQQIFSFCYAHNICIHPKSSNLHNNRAKLGNVINTYWRPPQYPWLKVNFDVSILPCTNFAGFSLVIRNHVGEFVEAMAWTRTVRDVDQAEVLALQKVLKCIRSNGFKQGL